VYTFLLPKCENLRASKGLKPLPFPKCFYASEEEELLIMENLKLQKFVVIQKKPERKISSIFSTLGMMIRWSGEILGVAFSNNCC
jgi:hypothetical protein